MPYSNPTGLPSVTEVLRPYLSYGCVSQETLDRKADIGERCHAAISGYLTGEFVVFTEDVSPYFESFRSWADAMIIEPMLIESRLVDPILGFTGQIDCVAILQGESTPTLIDWKTTAGASEKTWALQTAAYAHLYRSQIQDVNVRRIVVRLHDDGSQPTVHEFTQFKRDFAVFISLLNVHNYFHKGDTP